jgi:hypothetical protein
VGWDERAWAFIATGVGGGCKSPDLRQRGAPSLVASSATKRVAWSRLIRLPSHAKQRTL